MEKDNNTIEKMYMFSVDYGIEEVKAFVDINMIYLIYGEKTYKYFIDANVDIPNNEYINDVYLCSLVTQNVSLPENIFISLSLEAIKTYIDNMFIMFKKYEDDDNDTK